MGQFSGQEQSDALELALLLPLGIAIATGIMIIFASTLAIGYVREKFSKSAR